MQSMPFPEPWKSYLEAGMELSEVTRQRAEKVVKDLVKAGEVQAHEAQERIEALLERSRQTSEAVADLVRAEVQKQMQNLGLVQPVKQASAAGKQATDTAKKATSTAKKATGTAKKKATSTAKKAASTAKKATGS